MTWGYASHHTCRIVRVIRIAPAGNFCCIRDSLLQEQALQEQTSAHPLLEVRKKRVCASYLFVCGDCWARKQENKIHLREKGMVLYSQFSCFRNFCEIFPNSLAVVSTCCRVLEQ